MCADLLADGGSICWQVGNYVSANAIVPLDLVLYPVFRRLRLTLRNRIVWHFEHGLHSTRRLSGRHETVLWFTKGNNYTFNLDPIRVPQKYPGKRHFKGPNNGSYSGNPRGKNPGDVWALPNVKHNHVEKTIHPCQFPVELVERLVLALTNEGDLVVDPYIGVGSTAIGAVMHGRRAAGSDIRKEYLDVARQRLESLQRGELRTRPMYQPVYEPAPGSPLLRREASPNAKASG
jgi:adenine-specific DNA-methyltransferase